MHIKREIHGRIKAHLNQREILLITGARQVGKTTLMLKLREDVAELGKKSIFFNLDFEEDFQFFTSQTKLLQKLQLELGGEESYVFIDEIQRKENAGLFLKGVFDRNLPYKFIVSGSGSLELKEKIHESLAGRKRVFELFPVSFTEFVNFKTDYAYHDKLEAFFEIERKRLMELLLEYLAFGGYPRVVTEVLGKEKFELMKEIYTSYIQKDVAWLLKVENTHAFSRLISLLSAQTGRLTNMSQLSTDSGISFPTLKKYLWYAEHTFIVKMLHPFFKNPKKEITKSPVVYFNDLGVKNFALGRFGNLTEQDAGFVFQNFIFTILFQKAEASGRRLSHWRSKDRAEVDFVIQTRDEAVPVEVKFSRIKKDTVSRSLRSFIATYSPSRALLINLDRESKMRIGETDVEFLPFHKLLLDGGPPHAP